MFLLITRPRYDPATHYLFHWSGIILERAKNRVGARIKSLDKGKVVKRTFQSYLLRQPVDVVVINGHGSAESVCGQDGEVILSIHDGTDLVKGKSFFVRACDAGSLLGPDMIKKGALGFIGYTQPFIFTHREDSFSKPLEDELAGPILECSNQVGLSLVKGKSVEEAQEESMNKYKRKVDELSSSDSGLSYLLPFLFWNMSCQVCYH